jgi:hypothetical protein
VICRLWRGWTTGENARAYEAIVRGEVIPGIEAQQILPRQLRDDIRRGPLEVNEVAV